MDVKEIKRAVDAGLSVFWVNETYPVIKDDIGQYLIKCTTSTMVFGLTHVDGETLNGYEFQFYVHNDGDTDGDAVYCSRCGYIGRTEAGAESCPECSHTGCLQWAHEKFPREADPIPDDISNWPTAWLKYFASENQRMARLFEDWPTASGRSAAAQYQANFEKINAEMARREFQ